MNTQPDTSTRYGVIAAIIIVALIVVCFAILGLKL